MSLNALAQTLSLLRRAEIVDFDISDLTLEGERVFSMSNIKRADMPQLRGFPRGGSVACQLALDKKGKVDVADEFLNWLVGHFKIQVWQQDIEPRFITGAQNELVASKIARHVEKMRRDPNHKKFTQQYIISKDGVLLDGHHGWASVLIHDLLTEENHKLSVTRLGMDIDALIGHARMFTQMIGVMPKEGV